MRGLLILDFGSQYTQLIAKKVRECFVYCEVAIPILDELFNFTDDSKLSKVNGIILSGSPNFVDNKIRGWVNRLLEKYSEVPILGICYGHQLLTDHFCSTQTASTTDKENTEIRSEYGKSVVTLEDRNHPILRGIKKAHIEVWMSHQSSVENIPEGWRAIGFTSDDPYSIVSSQDSRYTCMQFHPEVDHTPLGTELLRNFATEICGMKKNWKPLDQCMQIRKMLKTQVTEHERVILALSGGCDSTVAAHLLVQSLSIDRVWCVFVDNGLLKNGELERVKRLFGNLLGDHLIISDSKDIFLNELEGVRDPEKKRKIIGKLFVDVIEKEAKSLGVKIHYFAQGTIYSDVIESSKNAAKNADNIKSHHNVGGLPEKMNYKLLEPLRNLFKNEVRQVGLSLGIPKDVLFRHPFPGPGLGIRIVGPITVEKLETVRIADQILDNYLRKYKLYDTISQAYAGLLDSKCTGVKGDLRVHGDIIIIRCVKTNDFMTAHFKRIDYDILEMMSTEITNKLINVTKVVYDITNKPPSTIELE